MYLGAFYFKTQTLVEAPNPPQHVMMNGMNQEKLVCSVYGDMESFQMAAHKNNL